MEPRANHLLIGVFVLLGIVGLFVFVIWLGRVQITRDVALYRIYFEESVYGLNTGGDVRYRGIRVGSVRNIRVNPRDPTRAEVLVEIDAATPIREGDTATLALQGITGLVYVNIKGAGAGDPPLVAEAGQDYPVIPAEPSQLAELASDAPQLLNRAITLLEQLTAFVDETNRANVGRILQDLAGFTGTLAGSADNIDRSLRNLDQASRAIRDLSENANALLVHAEETLTGADRILEANVEDTLSSIAAAADSIQQLADRADQVLEENREPLRNFTYDGLNELERFVNEARLLVSSLTRLTDQIESRGAGAFFGNREGEFRPER